ncbi:hypothetical protein ACA910_001428 [Epithemia clementina (nom. ined.)]
MMSPETPKPDKGESVKEQDNHSPKSEQSGVTEETETSKSVATLSEEVGINEKQRGFPTEILSKTYTPIGDAVLAEADLVKDLEAFGLIDDYKFIGLDCEGKAYWKEMPTRFREEAIEEIAEAIESQNAGVLTRANSEIKLYGGAVGKFPDLAIWGPQRVVTRAGGKKKEKKKKVDEFSYEEPMNPNVVIEFSWRNKLVEEEIPKFMLEMNDHHESLGEIKVGFLIKTIPSKGTAFPTESDRSIPLCGFDVYELRRGGGQINPTEPTLRYRVSESENVFIGVTAEDLDSTEGFQIPLGRIRDRLTKEFELKFEKAEK